MMLWVTKSKLEVGIKCLKKWGYHLKDVITWVKVDKNGSPEQLIGKYLSHSVELCLLGFKGRVEEFPATVMMGSITDCLVARREGMQSQKPDLLYDLIEQYVPGQMVYEAYARYP